MTKLCGKREQRLRYRERRRERGRRKRQSNPSGLVLRCPLQKVAWSRKKAGRDARLHSVSVCGAGLAGHRGISPITGLCSALSFGAPPGGGRSLKTEARRILEVLSNRAMAKRNLLGRVLIGLLQQILNHCGDRPAHRYQGDSPSRVRIFKFCRRGDHRHCSVLWP
jgi:hypothetical protein